MEIIPSTFSTPNPVMFGEGTASVVGEKLKGMGCKKVLVVFDKGIKASGVADKIAGYIESAGIETVCYDGVIADVPDHSIATAADFAISHNVDGIVAVGGGSSLDTAKGVRILLTNPPPISRYYAGTGIALTDVLSSLKPLIVLPTTSGTGSEVSPGGVIVNTETNFKEHILCPVTLGIIDPELTLAMPQSVTVITAFDALCHAIEAVTSREPNVFSELFGLKSISLIAKNLPLVLKDGKNLAARGGMHLAATMGTMSILGPFCNVPHDIGLIIGMDHDIPHGIASSATLPESLEFIAPAIPDTLKKVVEALGAEIPDGAGAEELGKIANKTTRDLMNLASLPSIKNYVKSKEEFLSSVPRIMELQTFYFSPRPVTEADVRDILSKAYDAAPQL